MIISYGLYVALYYPLASNHLWAFGPPGQLTQDALLGVGQWADGVVDRIFEFGALQ